MAKILIATEKPFAKVAVDGIKEVAETAGLEIVLLEKYTEKAQLLAAVADVEAMIIRSDKIDNEVFDAAKNLKIVVRAGAGYDNGCHRTRGGGDEHSRSEFQCRSRTGVRYVGIRRT